MFIQALPPSPDRNLKMMPICAAVHRLPLREQGGGAGQKHLALVEALVSLGCDGPTAFTQHYIACETAKLTASYLPGCWSYRWIIHGEKLVSTILPMLLPSYGRVFYLAAAGSDSQGVTSPNLCTAVQTLSITNVHGNTSKMTSIQLVGAHQGPDLLTQGVRTGSSPAPRHAYALTYRVHQWLRLT